MKYDVSIVFPCLNEEQTLDECIKNTKKVMNKTKYKYEIIVVDNGSTDDSKKIAKSNKVVLLEEKTKGYGSALITGINNAKGKYTVMLDADCSYNFEDIPAFVDKINEGYDMVVGNRFNERSEKAACPFTHRIGAKGLSLTANMLFHTKVKDFHCGLRIFNTKKVQELNLQSTGMEFASDMIIQAKLNKFKIANIDTKYMKDKREGRSHLFPLRDGFRHLKLINKLKFENSIIFRYLTTFIFVVVICYLLLLLSTAFKFNTSQNLKNSYLEYKDSELVNTNVFERNNPSYRIDYVTDQRMLSIAYLMDRKDPISSTVEMNFFYDLQYRENNEELMNNPDNQLVSNYSRYWHGYIILLKPLFSIFKAKTIYIIQTIIFIILLITVLIKLFQRDKLLAIMFIIGLVTINIFIVPLCFEYVNVFFLLLIMILLLLKMYDKKSKNLDLLFFIGGMLTCYFDFLTVETITISVPMLIYVYLKYKDKDPIGYKEFFKYPILWFVGYAGMYIVKWAIDAIYYGPEMLKSIYNQGMFRVNGEKHGVNLKVITGNLTNAFIFLFPFNFIYSQALFFEIGFILLALYDFIFYEKDKKHKFMFILIALVPIARYIALTSHAIVHMYFTYRALLPFTMIVALGVYRLIINIKNDQKQIENKSK